MNPGAKWIFIGGFAVLVAAMIGIERQRAEQLRREAEAGREKRREWQTLIEENRRWPPAPTIAAEAAALAKTEDELARLRAEMARLKAALDEVPRPVAEHRPRATGAIVLPAAEWKNAGRGTSRATVETALWAAAGGDIDVLVQALAFDVGGRAAAERLLAGLPPDRRGDYGTAERLIALIAAKELRSGTVEARLTEAVDEEAGQATVRVRLRDAAGVTQRASLNLGRAGDGWRVIVSERAVARYAAALKGESAAK